MALEIMKCKHCGDVNPDHLLMDTETGDVECHTCIATRNPVEEYPECTHTSYVTCGCCGQEVCGECGKERYMNHRNPHSPKRR